MPTVHQRVRDILDHTSPLPTEFRHPHPFYLATGTDIIRAIDYFERKVTSPGTYQNVADRHLGRIHRTAFVELVENFEQFVKQLAAVCVNVLAPYVVDDRFDKFTVKGSVLAAHFGAGRVGDALCESATWLDTDLISERFRKLLSFPGSSGAVFDLSRKDAANQPDFLTLGLIWQLRHTVVHNVGLVTRSDATKIRVLSNKPVPHEVLLAPTRIDLGYLKTYLDGVALQANSRVGTRLSDVLDTYLQNTPGLFDPQLTANEISTMFQLSLTIGGLVGVVTTP